MLKRDHSISVLILSTTLTLLLIGCSPKLVAIGPPYERYDHNRTQKIVIASDADAQKNPARAITNEVYIPFGSQYFSSAHCRDESPAQDGLPAANVVPIFTGVSLPLSDDAPSGGGQSDLKDLIDFLASGPFAQAGVERGGMTEEIISAEATYRPVLNFLKSKELLSREGKQFTAGLPSREVVFKDNIVDSRYSLLSFKCVLAFRFEKFWFILYKLPGAMMYSRLVVVPVRGKVKDRYEKNYRVELFYDN